MFLIQAPSDIVRRPVRDFDLTVAAGLFAAATAAIAILVAKPYLQRTAEEKGEFYALLLWGHLGVFLMIRGLDLLIVFIGLETLSLSFYVLAAFFRTIPASSEAGLKYFLTGAFASAFTLYGVALLFGKSGSIRIAGLSRPDLATDPLVALAPLAPPPRGVSASQMSLAPFHAWLPTSIRGSDARGAYLSVAPKGSEPDRPLPGAVRGLPSGMPDRFRAGIAALAILSMSLGNVVASTARHQAAALPTPVSRT